MQTNELNAEKAIQKATKKTKSVQCKMTLLDGTEYTCDLEVSQGTDGRALLMCGMQAEVHSALICGMAQFLCSCELDGHNFALQKNEKM